jgi:hypothetical protein
MLAAAMDRSPLDIDPYRHDPSHWGVSLVNNAELIVGVLDAAGAKSVVEVGAFAGDLTEMLLDWARTAGARVGAVDPAPQAYLEKLDAERDDLDLVRATSHEALRTIAMPDAIVIDGDHNWWTVREELRIIAERAPGAEMPLLMFHDVCWPHARRDDYYDPEQIPAEFRHEIVKDGTVVPGESAPGAGGLPYRNPAAHEGGPRNGVLTAIEDFVADHDGLRLAVVSSFFGFGVVWHEGTPWAGAVEQVVGPLDRHPVLERLEANRVRHLVSLQQQIHRANDLERRLAARDALLRTLLESGTFSAAEKVSRLRQRGGGTAVSKDEIRRVLSE